MGTNFKIILLLRDPRAVINSIHIEPKEWHAEDSNPKRVCKNILQDYMAVKKVSTIISTNMRKKSVLSRFDFPHDLGAYIWYFGLTILKKNLDFYKISKSQNT